MSLESQRQSDTLGSITDAKRPGGLAKDVKARSAPAMSDNTLEFLSALASDSDAGNQAAQQTADNVDPAATTGPGSDSKSAESEGFPFLQPSRRADSLGRIGHYEVLQVLGRGAFGIVFRAFDDMLQRVVAVKVLAPEVASTSPARKRFLREARASAQIRHENVVQVHAVEEKPLPYLVMEFIPGETLQQRLDRTGPLDLGEIVRIGRQTAEGLSAAHATDLIHRDIKPGNILLEGGQHRIKITDFGLARAADDASISQSGLIAGTPMYMAPEQAAGGSFDQRADLFSLGSVLYQMTTGRPPFRANCSLTVLKRVLEDTPRPIREIIPEAPVWLCQIIEKLHEKDPAARFQTAREVADIFAECEANLRQDTRPLNLSRWLPERPAETTAPRKWIGVAGGVLAVAFVLALASSLFRNNPTNSLEKSQSAAAPSAPNIPQPTSTTPQPTLTPTPVERFALRFAGGDNHVNVPNLQLDGRKEFTIEACVRWREADEKGTIFVSFGDPLFAIDVEKGNIVPFLLREREFAHHPGTKVNGTSWRYLAATVDDRKVTVFIDGTRQTTHAFAPAKIPDSVVLPGNRFLIGAGLAWDVPAIIYPFQGEIAELRVSRGIRYHANYARPESLSADAETLAFYPFKEGAGEVLKDASGNGYHGTISGATWVKKEEGRSR